jgi:hypothetical protein
MRGLMIDRPLLISSPGRCPARRHGDVEVVPRTIATRRDGYRISTPDQKEG